MRKLMIGLLGAAALGLGTAANAQVTIDDSNLDVVIPDDHGDTFSAGFLELGGDSPFDHFITFTEALAGTYGFTLTTTATTDGTGGIAPATDVEAEANAPEGDAATPASPASTAAEQVVASQEAGHAGTDAAAEESTAARKDDQAPGA